jgi:ABC-type phosphate/phosphonate transport system substrate-binding protein
MIRLRSLAAVLVAALAAVAARPAGAEETAQPKRLAVVPFYAPEKMWQLYAPFVQYLRAQTGEPWELRLPPTHEAMDKAVCAGEFDVALVGPVPLARLNRACGVVPFLGALSRDGQETYHAMLLTADPSVRTVADLRGRKVGFFRGSTAAHILPVKMLHDAGIANGTFEAVFFESQDRIVTALLEHRIDGGGVKESLYRRFRKEPLRLLQTSEPVPNFAFVALPSQPAAFRERFVAALLKLRPRESAADAEAMKAWDDEVKGGFALPGPDVLAQALRLGELTTMPMHGR